MQHFAEFGAEIRRRFAHSVAETEGRGETIELPLKGAPMKVEMAIARQDSANGDDKLKRVWQENPVVNHVADRNGGHLQGERVVEYVVEGMVGDQWRELSRGSSIGHKKIDRFAPMMCSSLRLRCTKTLAEPIIRRFAAFNTCWDWWKAR